MKISSNGKIVIKIGASSVGTLKEWDITNQHSEIRVPSLVVCGRYDEATPTLVETIQKAYLDLSWSSSSTARTSHTSKKLNDICRSSINS
jgi:hypothetical protein